MEALDARDVATAEEIVEGDREINALRRHVDEQAFILIATQQPTASDLRFVMASTMVASELERIGDYSSGIAKLTLSMVGEPVGGSTEDIKQMAAITRELLSKALDAFRLRDVQAAAAIWTGDDDVDDLYERTFRNQIDEMVEHPQRIRGGTYMLCVAHNIERMADRVTNIAENTAFVATGDVASFRERIEAESIPG